MGGASCRPASPVRAFLRQRIARQKIKVEKNQRQMVEKKYLMGILNSRCAHKPMKDAMNACTANRLRVSNVGRMCKLAYCVIEAAVATASMICMVALASPGERRRESKCGALMMVDPKPDWLAQRERQKMRQGI